VRYTTIARKFAEYLAQKLNETHPNHLFVFYEVEEVAPGFWRVARVFRRSLESAWERESVPVPDEAP
jgi:hypothetical protein